MTEESPREGPACQVYVPAIEDPPELTAAASRGLDWFRVAAYGTWIVCGLWPLSTIVAGTFAAIPATLYVCAFLVYGLALRAMLRLPHAVPTPGTAMPIGLALVESVTGIAMNVLTVRYIHGSGVGMGFLVIVAAQLPYFLSARATWVWIGVQVLVLTPLLLPGDVVEVLTFGGAMAAFQVFAAAASMLGISEGRARTTLARANTELTATRELLAENSRISERLRISRDLHDTLGHHLTALSLQLDVASRLTEGKAEEHVRQAHAITRLLLSDVRDVVSSLRGSSRINLSDAIRALAVQPCDAHVHLDLPDAVTMDDASRAETILRAVQEVMTNTARHAAARNLWIRLAFSEDGLILRTRDDGRGADAMTLGNGLRGMRERFEAHGGRVEFRAAAGGGFEVEAVLPLPAP
jgi:signal transduction histidine kinase